MSGPRRSFAMTAPGIPALAAAALAAVLLAPALARPAGAAEWTVTGSVSERVEAETNRDLDSSTEGVYGTTTRFAITARRETARSAFTVDAGVSGALFGGPDDTEDLDRIDPDFAATYRFDGLRLDFDTSLGFEIRPASFAQIEETGVTTGDATQLTVRIAADIAYAVDAANRLTLGGDARIVRFTSGTTSLTEITTFGLDAGWEHMVNRRLVLDLGFGVRRFGADNATDTRSLSFDVTAGASYRVNARLSFSASVGLDVTRTLRMIGGLRDAETSLGVTAAATADWQPRQDTTLTLSFSQGLEPSSLGELQTTTRLSLAASHQVTPRVGFDLGIAYLRQRSGGGFAANGTRRDLLTVSPGMSFVLSRDWSARLGYTLRFESEAGTGGDAVSHLAFLEFTRSLDILP